MRPEAQNRRPWAPGRAQLTPARRDRRYELGAPLGQGSFGVVYEARLHEAGGFQKSVAIKLLHEEMAKDPELASRLRDEARMLMLIDHPAIVKVDGLLQVGGSWGVVMELVSGPDLQQVLEQEPIPARAALEIVGEVASALDTCWGTPAPGGQPLRLIHRDIKPSNIKVTATGAVKLLDFGIARAEFGSREARTRHRAFGSRPYMSPERLHFEDGPEGDVYALGVVLFECITRHQLYEVSPYTDPYQHHERVLQAQDLVWETTGQASEDLVYLIGQMLTFEPEDRPTADEVARRCDALAEAIGGARRQTWARDAAPRVLASQGEPEAGELGGAVLLDVAPEPSATPVSGPDPAPTPPRRSDRDLELGVLLGLLLVLGLGAAALTGLAVALVVGLLHLPGRSVAAEPVPAPPPVVVAVPVEEAEDAAAPESPPVAEPVPEPAPEPPPEPVAAVVQPKAKRPSSGGAARAGPEPSASKADAPAEEDDGFLPIEALTPSSGADDPWGARTGEATVTVTGSTGATLTVTVDGQPVVLQRSRANLLPHGTYDVSVDFRATGRHDTFQLVIHGDQARIDCNSRGCKQAR